MCHPTTRRSLFGRSILLPILSLASITILSQDVVVNAQATLTSLGGQQRQQEPRPTLYELVQQNNKTLSTLGDLLEATGLDESILADVTAGPLTLLAPTDEAFEESSLLNSKYLEPQWNDFLAAVLKFHVLQGKALMAADLEPASPKKVPTWLPGKVVTATRSELLEDRMILSNDDDMQVVTSRKIGGNASNGVLHFVDGVLLPPNMQESLLEQMENNPELSMFLDYATRLNLTDTLEQEGPMTLLIPTNEAFETIPPFLLKRLDDEALTQILKYHMLPGIAMTYNLGYFKTQRVKLQTMLGATLDLYSKGVVGVTNFTSKDSLASNGVWHTIDTVLIPVFDEEVEPVVVWDEPVVTILRDTTDDAPSMAPLKLIARMPTSEPQTSETNSIVTVRTTLDDVRSEASLSDLFDALVLTGLDDTLDGQAEYTVFAPVNDAFDSANVNLFTPNFRLHLKALLQYHLVPGDIMWSEDFVAGTNFLTAEGSTVNVTQTDPTILLNDNKVQVLTPDVAASNGVVHTVDQFLLPPSFSTSVGQVVAAHPQLGRFAALLQEYPILITFVNSASVTILGAVDSAFDGKPMPVDTAERRRVVMYHIIPQVVPSTQLVNGAIFTTLENTKVMIIKREDSTSINDAVVVESDILGNNGILHLIDAVLVPVADGEPVGPVGPTPTDPSVVNPTPLPTTSVPAATATPTSAPTPEAATAAPITSSPSSSPPTDPPMTAAPAPPPAESSNGGCSSTLAAMAPHCCPVVYTEFQEFCDQLKKADPIVAPTTSPPTSSPVVVSTSMPTTAVPVATETPTRAPITSSPTDPPATSAPSTSPPATDPPVTAAPTSPPTAKAVPAASPDAGDPNGGCDSKLSAWAPECCPVLDSKFDAFCDQLKSRNAAFDRSGSSP